MSLECDLGRELRAGPGDEKLIKSLQDTKLRGEGCEVLEDMNFRRPLKEEPSRTQRGSERKTIIPSGREPSTDTSPIHVQDLLFGRTKPDSPRGEKGKDQWGMRGQGEETIV